MTAVGIERIATAAKTPKRGTHASQPGTVHGDMSVVKRGQFWLVILFENKNKIEKLTILKKRQPLKEKGGILDFIGLRICHGLLMYHRDRLLGSGRAYQRGVNCYFSGVI